MGDAAIQVGGVELLYGTISDWAYPQFGAMVRTLATPSSVDNETLQGGAVPRRRATVTGWLQEQADVDTLDGYAATKQIITVVDGLISREAVVMDCSHSRQLPGLWNLTVLLADFGATGS